MTLTTELGRQIRADQTAQVATPRHRKIPECLDRLSITIDDLVDKISKLREMLEPALKTDTSKQEAPVDKVRESSSIIATDIKTQIARIESVIGTINYLIVNLEL